MLSKHLLNNEMNRDLILVLRSDLWLDLMYAEIAQEFSSSESKEHGKLFAPLVPSVLPPTKPGEATCTSFKELEVSSAQAEQPCRIWLGKTP